MRALLGLLLIAHTLTAQALLVGGACQTASAIGSGTATTAGINTASGTNGPATLYIIGVTAYNGSVGACSGNASDSGGNAWHCTTSYRGQYGNQNTAIFYAWDHAGSPLATGTSQTFSWAGNGLLTSPSIIACAFRGTTTSSSPAGAEVGIGANGATSPGTLTPASGDLLIAVVGDPHTSTLGIGSSFVITNQFSVAFPDTLALAWRIGNGSAISPTWTGLQFSGTTPSEAMQSFAAGATCTITTASLSNPVIGTAYSATLATTNCVSPTFSLQSGTLPVGMSFSGTGVLSGTPSSYQGTTLARTFTIQVTDTVNGSSTATYSITTAAAALPAGNPALTNISYAGNANSICATYTADTPSQITVQAGTASGGPYTTYSTGVLFPVNLYGTGSNGFGTLGPTTTCLIVPNSASVYWVQIVADNDHSLNGGTQTITTPTSVTTAAATVTTQLVVLQNPNVDRPNDQYNGANGGGGTGSGVIWPTTGKGHQSDTGWTAYVPGWGWFGSAEDWGGIYAAGAWSGGSTSGYGFIRWPTADMLNPSAIGSLALNSPISCRSGPSGSIYTGGSIYYSEHSFACDHNVGVAANTYCCWNILRSLDQFTSTIRPEDNTTFPIISKLGLVEPSVGIITGVPTVAGTAVTIATTANISIGTRVQVSNVTCATGTANTSGVEMGIVTATSTSSMTYTISTASNLDTCSTSVNSVVMAALDTQLHASFFTQYAGGSYDSAPPIAGLDAFVYAWDIDSVDLVSRLTRTRKEDMQLQRYDRVAYYKGTRAGADGMIDAASTGAGAVWDVSASKVANALQFVEFPLDHSTFSLGQTCQHSDKFIPDFNRFVLVCNADQYGNNFSGGVSWWERQYPWSHMNYAGRLHRNVIQQPYHSPAFVNITAGTYTRLSTTPLSAWARVITSGTAVFQNNGSAANPAATQYTVWMRSVNFAPASPTTGTRAYFGYGSRQMPSKGLLAAYLFQDLTGLGVIADASGNGHNITAAGGQQVNTDRLGEYHWASPCALGYPLFNPIGCAVAGLPTGITTAFTQATFADCFQHSPVTSILAAVSGEIVSQKGTSDYILARSTTTDTWQVSINNTAVGSPIAVTDNTLACIVTTWDGTTANSYLSSAIGSTLPLTPTATVGVSGTMSAGALYLGSSGGTNTAHVIRVFSGVWDHAMTAAELMRTRAGLAALIRDKGAVLP
jgi:hypothetical protein